LFFQRCYSLRLINLNRKCRDAFAGEVRDAFDAARSGKDMEAWVSMSGCRLAGNLEEGMATFGVEF
jgi:hypothetical protein